MAACEAIRLGLKVDTMVAAAMAMGWWVRVVVPQAVGGMAQVDSEAVVMAAAQLAVAQAAMAVVGVVAEALVAVVTEVVAQAVAARAAVARAASRCQFAASATNISSSKHISSWKLAAHTVPCSFTRERRTHEKRACRIDGARRGVGGARNCRVLRARKMQVCVEPLCVCCALEMCQLGATGCS